MTDELAGFSTKGRVSRPAASAIAWPEAQTIPVHRAATGRAQQLMLAQSGLLYDWEHGQPIPYRTGLARRLRLGAKRLFDICMSLVGLIILSPLLVLVALAIRLTSRGSALFRQSRVGYRGTHFRILKFRTMYVEQGDPSGVRQTISDDDRVTPFGRFLRKTSLDELPQLFNVLMGNMSLVGPRPHVVGQFGGGMLYEDFVSYYDVRHSMRPGLTGWAQVNGLRGPTDQPEKALARVDHDIAYIQRFTLFLDVKILFTTVWRELRSPVAF